MPKVSKDTAPHVEDIGPLLGRYGELDGYTVGFEHFREDADATPLFKGLPDDRCQAPHWGYVLAGQLVVTYTNETQETCSTNDLFYWPPGHSVRVVENAEVVLFSPYREHTQVLDHMLARMGSD